MIAKSRVVGLNTTIPRLELQSALIVIRLAEFLEKEHEFKITRRIFSNQYKSFVANRLGEIQDESKINEWRWVLSRENPADNATRFVPDAISNNSRWFYGPNFLKLAESHWPKQDANYMNTTSVEEVESHEINERDTVFLVDKASNFIDLSHFLSWIKLVRVISFVLQFINNCQKQKLSTIELNEAAELCCLRCSQMQLFDEEIFYLKRGQSVHSESRRLSFPPC